MKANMSAPSSEESGHIYTTVGVRLGIDRENEEILAALEDIASAKSNDEPNSWSYYSNEDTFIRFLGMTSYYLGLQDNLARIIKILKPTQILELGFGTGHSSVRIAKQNASSSITAIDLREKMLPIARALASRFQLTNINFEMGEMTHYVQQDLHKFDFIFLLYNFHHIPDSVNTQNEKKRNAGKLEFLRNCYNNMKDSAYLCIADLFIPNNDEDIKQLFEHRVNEGYASTFWNGLGSLGAEDISEARRAADFCKRNEEQVGIKVVNREHEFPITREWLKKSAREAGFAEVLNENINDVGDAIMLFQRC